MYHMTIYFISQSGYCPETFFFRRILDQKKENEHKNQFNIDYVPMGVFDF